MDEDKAETAPMQGPGLFLSGPSLAGRAQFEEPRWPLRVALNWLAFGKVDLLTIGEDDARSLRFQSTYGGDSLKVAKNPHIVLRRALVDGAIAAIGPDNKNMSPEDWDMTGFDWRLWPAVRFRREDIERLRRELAGEPSSASARPIPAPAEAPIAAEEKAGRRKRAPSLVKRLAGELTTMYPDGRRPTMSVEEIRRELAKRPGTGRFSKRTLEEAVATAWPQRSA